MHRMTGRIIQAGLQFVLGITLTSVPALAQFDLILKNGKIVDGTGNPWYVADVAVREGRIAAIGTLDPSAAARVIDLEGLFLAPGFIDVHNHSDAGLGDPELRLNQVFITQGVSTLVVGVDGNGTWDIESRVAPWKAQGIGVNVANYVGHNAIRLQVMGIDKREPAADELDRMKALVREGMENGAFGLSTGLEYIPGIYSRTPEVIELARVAAEYSGLYDSHYRDEFHGFLDSVREGIEIAEKAGIPVNLGHFKVIGAHNWGKMAEGIELIEQARRKGLQITADQYPWSNGATSTLIGLLQVPEGLGRVSLAYRQLQVQKDPRRQASGPAPGTPGEAAAGQREYVDLLQSALQDPRSRESIRRATEGGIDEAGHRNWISMWGYDWIRIVRSSRHPEFIGSVLTEITAWKGTSAFDLLADLVVEEGADLGVSIGPLAEADVRLAMRQPWVMISSDGSLPRFGAGFPHPRSYASFPRALGYYVREEGVLRLEDAIRKMTSLPAQTLGLRERGLIRPGNWADLTAFDAGRIEGRATYENPHQYSTGVVHVWVNGVAALQDGKMTGEAAGRILYGPGRRQIPANEPRNR